MASEISTIQSLKAVDAWIDVINANINGGVRTAFKSSRLKFSGSNTDVQRAGTTTSLPLQFPEPGLTTANTVIDFTQGAITASTENTHLAVQGTGFFLVASADLINTTAGATFGGTKASATGKFLLTRDGEFRTDQNGFLVNSNGYYLVSVDITVAGGRNVLQYDTTTFFGAGTCIRAIYNDMDNAAAAPAGLFYTLSNYLAGTPGTGDDRRLVQVQQGIQNLQYTTYGATVFSFGFQSQTAASATQVNSALTIAFNKVSPGNVLNKSLEASNASMTQSVPELSLAQKLFSALTKVLQTKQTNVDGVLNLVR
jgi:flagellar hook protein FlgE